MRNVIRQYLIDNKYNTALDETYDHIDNWLEWYQNDVKKFHHYKVWNGVIMTKHERYRLGMAKKVCEDWANLLLNEKVTINAGVSINGKCKDCNFRHIRQSAGIPGQYGAESAALFR